MTSGWPLPFGICYAMLGRARSGGMHCAARLDCSAVQLRARSRWPAVEDSVTGDITNVASLKEERPVQSSSRREPDLVSNPIAVRVRVLVRAAKHAWDAGRGPLCGWILLHCCRSLSPPDKYVHYLARYCLGACFILSPEHEIHMLPN
jgi:hypothetical protein